VKPPLTTPPKRAKCCTNLPRIIFFKKVGAISFCYLVSLDGALKVAIRRYKIDGVDGWSAIPIAEARQGFEKELAFWRIRQEELSNEPDRKD
jgi:hypothetical protein